LSDFQDQKAILHERYSYSTVDLDLHLRNFFLESCSNCQQSQFY